MQVGRRGGGLSVSVRVSVVSGQQQVEAVKGDPLADCVALGGGAAET